jgi:hypothetical protein
MIEEALRAPLSVTMLKIDGTKLMDMGIEKGPKIGHILYTLFDEVLEDPEKNTEAYLMGRAEVLNQLTFAELEKLGKQGKDRLSLEDEKEVKQLRKKHHVE